jgi:hypothetical protein
MQDYEKNKGDFNSMNMNTSDVVRTLTPVVEVLEQLNVPYHIGGSVASSLYGEGRSTQDVDIVADMRLSHVHLFATLLEIDYYVVEDAIRDAIRRRSSFNLISNETFMKVDIFIRMLGNPLRLPIKNGIPRSRISV